MIDGEIITATDHGVDFEALKQRIHPADSRVQMLAERTPASFIAFDLLALGDDGYTSRPFSERRAALVDALADSGPSIHVTPATTDLATAQRWFDKFEGAGLDGVVGAFPMATRRQLFVEMERTATHLQPCRHRPRPRPLTSSAVQDEGSGERTRPEE